jgi:HlyD family secretion protein
VLFTLAEDLARMELHVDVDEADVGQVRDGQEARFTVDAYPERTFPARITQVRYGAKTVDGVVTYETLLRVDNSDLTLRPGMTATADIIVHRVKGALLVPNAALRFTPPRREPGQATRRGGSLLSQLVPRPPREPRRPLADAVGGQDRSQVWTLRDGMPVPIGVTTGWSDGVRTQVLAADPALEPGTLLLVDTLESRD